MLRVAQEADFDQVMGVYADSMAYADAYHLPTEWSITRRYFDYLTGNDELYVSDDGQEDDPLLHGAAVLRERFNPKEWEEQYTEQGLLVGKLATAEAVRGTRYLGRVLMPQIVEVASSRGKSAVCLNYREEDTGLRGLYVSLGFEPVGTNTFFSDTRQKDLTTVNMVKTV